MLKDNLQFDQKNKLIQQTVSIGSGRRLGLSHAKSFTQHTVAVHLSLESLAAIARSHSYLQSCIDKRMPIYGINTHFGDQVRFLDATINKDEELYGQAIDARQKKLILSHACGVGNKVSIQVTRIAMALRAHCLAQGYSGVTVNAVESILAFLNAGITPVVRCYGSIGASGDLIPLAMIASCIIGENVDVYYQNQIMKAPEAIAAAGLKKLIPRLRDGLAMINGTSFMTAIASLTLCNLNRLFKQMLCAIAMSLEAMHVISSAYQPFVHQLKNQLGEMTINNMLLSFWKGSQLLFDLDELRNNRTETKHLQDYYSLRSVAQGFGPFYENLERATDWIEREMNSVNDNPVIDIEKNKIYHGANFMGYYVTTACDTLKNDIAQASTWLHALLANMVHPNKNCNLPANLVEDPDKNNGFRPLQLLAAALAVQNRKLAQSQQSFMLPTEGDNQDVNSLGTHAALDFQESVANLERLTSILLLAAVQALEMRGIERASISSQKVYQMVRMSSAKLAECRPMTEEIEKIINLLQEEKI